MSKGKCIYNRKQNFLKITVSCYIPSASHTAYRDALQVLSSSSAGSEAQRLSRSAQAKPVITLIFPFYRCDRGQVTETQCATASLVSCKGLEGMQLQADVTHSDLVSGSPTTECASGHWLAAAEKVTVSRLCGFLVALS